MKMSRVFVNFSSIFLLLIVTLCLFHRPTHGQDRNKSLWSPVVERSLPEKGRRLLRPEIYRLYKVDRQTLTSLVRQMPLEFTPEALGKTVTMDVPMPDGTTQSFRIEDSPVLAPHLAAAFPTWRTFQGYGVDDPMATARFDWLSLDFMAISSRKKVPYISTPSRKKIATITSFITSMNTARTQAHSPAGSMNSRLS